MRVLSVDPGIATGFAVAYERFNSGPDITVHYNQRTMSVPEYFDLLYKVAPKAIVIEDFEYRRGNAKDSLVLYSVELIGVTKLYCSKEDVPLYIQKASVQGKNSAYFSDDRLKEMGLYIPGLQHGRSAVKHLLHWFQFGAGYPMLGDRKFVLYNKEG